MKESEAPAPSTPEEVVARIHAQHEKLIGQLQSINKFRWEYFALSWLISALFVWFIFYDLDTGENLKEAGFWLSVIAGGLALGLSIYFYFVWLFKTIYTANIKEQEKLLTGSGIETLQATLAEDFFTKLVRINFNYVDQYYNQTQGHANRSFILSLVIAVAGFVVIAYGIIMVFNDKTGSANVTIAGGVLSEFIAAVYFYLYNRTIAKMSEYHRKLVLTQNLSVALKITDVLPEKDRVKAQLELITQLSQDINKYLMQQEVTEIDTKQTA